MLRANLIAQHASSMIYVNTPTKRKSMIFDDNRNNYRTFFFSCWQKYREQKPLEPLEKQLVDIMLYHPEYHDLLTNPEVYLDRDYNSPSIGETNPFLHLGLHQALVEQLQTNRPKGITELFQHLVHKTGNTHQAEHQLMDVLMQFIYQNQNNASVTEQDYLNALAQL